MALAWKDRIKVASATTGTGTLTLGAAASGYRTFAAGDDGLRFDIVIEDGTAWETARNCLYTHSGTTLTRGTFSDSSTGSVLNLSGAEFLFVDLIAGKQTADDLATLTYITGLNVVRNGTTTIDISPGACYDPSSNKIISYAGTTGLSAGTLGVSQWNQVYIYDNAGTTTPEVVNNANPPSSTYAGTARQGGTNSNRRWIGSFLTTAASLVYPNDVKETGANQIEVTWLATTSAAPFRILSAGTATTFTAVSAVGCVPRYVASEALINHIVDNGTAGTSQALEVSIDGTNRSGNYNMYSSVSGIFPTLTSWDLLETSTPQIYYKLAAAGTPKGYLDISAYKASR